MIIVLNEDNDEITQRISKNNKIYIQKEECLKEEEKEITLKKYIKVVMVIGFSLLSSTIYDTYKFQSEINNTIKEYNVSTQMVK